MFLRANFNKTHTQPQTAAAKSRIFETHITGTLDVNILNSAYRKVLQRHEKLQHSPDHILINTKTQQRPEDYACQSQLIRNDVNSYTFRISFNSSMIDQQSINTFFSELNSYYNNHDRKNASGTSLELPMPKDKTMPLSEKEISEREAFWKSKLEDLANINLAAKPSSDEASPYASVPFDINQEKATKLRTVFAGASIDNLLVTTLTALLSRHCAQTDITIGWSTDNREQNFRPIGMFEQQLPIRIEALSDTSFTDLLNQASSAINEAKEKQLPSGDYTTVLSHETLESLRGKKPFDVLVSTHNYPPALHLRGTTSTPIRETSTDDSTASLIELKTHKNRDGSLSGKVLYNTASVSTTKAMQISSHLSQILTALCENPEMALKDMPLLSQSEMLQISTYNQTYLDGRFSSQIPDVINHLSTSNPDKEMLVFHGETNTPQRITYKEFAEYTSRIANHLRERYRLKKGDRVIISINRSYNTFAYIFGAMKAGLIPIPIESQKSELFDYKVTNSSAKIALVDQSTVKLFEPLQQSPETVNIDDPITAQLVANTDESHYPSNLTDEDPAYIMYSSGTSTGIPKRSVLTHGGFRNLLNALAAQGYEKDLKVLCTAPADFDAFLFDFLVAWATTGSIHLTEDAVRTSPEVITDIIRKEQIDYTVLLPELMSELAPDIPLRYLITMGAAPRPEICQAFLEANKDLTLINGWGLTEAGVCQSLENMVPGQDAGLIGRPIANMHMYILDKDLNLCPPEVPGEIYLSGPGLASKYDNNPELTASKFFTAAFDSSSQRFNRCSSDSEGAVRLFSTGDLGYYKQGAQNALSVKCIGRSDRRVKFCGVSLDLDAIEKVIAQSNLAASVAVKVDNPEDIKALHAFVVPSQSARNQFWSNEKELRRVLREAFMQSKLPQVACPQFVLIGRMPLTKNSKINYRKLDKPRDITSRALTQQTHDLLSVLKKMWKEILCNTLEDIDDVTTWEQLGGNSYGMAQLESRLNTELALRKRVDFTYLRKDMTIIDLRETLEPLVKKASQCKNSSETMPRTPNGSLLFANNATNEKSDEFESEGDKPSSSKTMN